MALKRCFPLLILILLLVFPLNAANVSFLVIETGVDEDGETNLYSGLWESGLLDVFFEAGHIVSNAPILRLSYMPKESFPEEAENDLSEALEGGIEYILVAQLNYQNQVGNRPRQVALRLFRTRPFELMYEDYFSDTKSRTTKEEYDYLKQAASTFVPRIK